MYLLNVSYSLCSCNFHLIRESGLSHSEAWDWLIINCVMSRVLIGWFAFQALTCSLDKGHALDFCIMMIISGFGRLNPLTQSIGWARLHLSLFSSCQDRPNVSTLCPQLSQSSACLARVVQRKRRPADCSEGWAGESRSYILYCGMTPFMFPECANMWTEA